MVMKCYPILVLTSLPGETTVLCTYFRPEWATCVTSLELLPREPETPIQVLLSSAQRLQVKQEQVIFTCICRKRTGMLKVSTRGEYGTGSSLTPGLLHLPYIRIYIKVMIADFKYTRLQPETGDSEHSPQTFITEFEVQFSSQAK